jgi:hypothetical protein
MITVSMSFTYPLNDQFRSFFSTTESWENALTARENNRRTSRYARERILPAFSPCGNDSGFISIPANT